MTEYLLISLIYKLAHAQFSSLLTWNSMFSFLYLFFSVVQDTFHANLMNCEINKSYLDRVNHTHETQQHLAYIIWYS